MHATHAGAVVGALLAALSLVGPARADDARVRLVEPFASPSWARGEHDVTFAAPASTDARWFLSVSGGSASLTVELNGERVVGPQDLARVGGRLLRVPVALRATNNLRVRVTGAGALRVTIQGVVPAADLPAGVGRPLAAMTLFEQSLAAGRPPRRHRLTVPVPTVEGLFTLQAQDGQPAPTERRLAWNGETVLGPGREPSATPVAVSLENVLEVFVVGADEARVVVTLAGLVVDDVAPEASWTSPAAGAAVTPTTPVQLVFSDARSGATLTRVELNGVDVTGAFTVMPGVASTTVGGLPATALRSGVNTLVATVRDGACNEAVASVTFRAGDQQPPVLEQPGDLKAEQQSPAGAIVTFALPAATDDTDPSPVVTCTPSSGALFPPGATTVTCTATDAAGNVAEVRFTVVVVDTTRPTVAVTPATGSVVAEGVVALTVTYQDAGSGVATERFAALLDGQDSTASFTVGAAGAEALVTLSAGTPALTVSVFDRAGLRTDASTTFVVERGPSPVVVVPPTLAFPSTRVTATTLATLAVQNGSADAALHVSAASVQGTTVFGVATPIPVGGLVVPPLGSVELALRFTPLALGTATAELVLTTDDPDRPTVTVELSGLGTHGQLELVLDPGPPTAIAAESVHRVRARAVNGAGELDAGFRGLVELTTTDPESALNGALLLFGDVEGGVAELPYLPIFATPGQHLVTARLVLADASPVVGTLAVSVLSGVRGRVFLVLSSAEGTVVRPGDLVTARLLVDVGGDDGDPTSFGDTLGGYDVRLLFDSDVVEVVAVSGSSPLGEPLFALRGSLRLMDMNDTGTLAAPGGPDPSLTGVVELATVTLRVLADAPSGRSPIALAVDALPTAEAPLRPLGEPGPRLAATTGELRVESVVPPPTSLHVLGGLPRVGEAILGPLQEVQAVDALLSRDVDGATIDAGSVRLRDALGVDVVGSPSSSGNDPALVSFLPDAPLTPGDYTLELSGTLAGLDGQTLDDTLELPFTVGAPDGEPVQGDLDGDGEVTILDLLGRRDGLLGRTEDEIPDFPPVFVAGSGALTLREGTVVTVPVSVVDPDGTPVALEFGALPEFVKAARLTPDTSLLTITPTFSDAGLATIELLGTSAGATTRATLVLTVENVNQAPTLAIVSPTLATAVRPEPQLLRVHEGGTLTLTFEATDPDLEDPKDPDEVTIALESGSLPGLSGPQLSFGGRRATYTFTPSFTQSGTHELVFGVTDRAGDGESLLVTIEVKNVNRRPTLVAVSPTISNTIVKVGDQVLFDFLASDLDGDPLVVAVNESTQIALDYSQRAGDIQVTQTSTGARLTLAVTFLRRTLSGLSVEAFASDDQTFSFGVRRRASFAPTIQHTLNGVAEGGGQPLVLERAPLFRVKEPPPDPLPDPPPPEEFMRVGTARVSFPGTLSFVALDGPQVEHLRELTWTVVSFGRFVVTFRFADGLSFDPNLAAHTLRVVTSTGTHVTPIVFVDGGSADDVFDPAPPEVLEATGTSDTFVRLRVRIANAALARGLSISSSFSPALFRGLPAAQDPLAPLELDVLVAVSPWMTAIELAVLYQTFTGYVMSPTTTVPITPTGGSVQDVYFVRPGPGGRLDSFETTHALFFGATLPEHERLEDQIPGPDNPYVFYLAHAVTGLAPADVVASLTGFSCTPQEIPMFPGNGLLRLRDGRETSRFMLSPPISFMFRAQPAGSITPVQVLGDRIVVSIGAPGGFWRENELGGPTAPLGGIEGGVNGWVEFLDEGTPVGWNWVDSMNAVTPALTLVKSDFSEVFLDGATAECHDPTLICYFPYNDTSPPDRYVLYLDGDATAAQVVSPTQRRGNLQIFDFQALGIELAPGTHRVRLLPAGQLDRAPFFEATFTVLEGGQTTTGRVLASKTSYDVPARLGCDGAVPGDPAQEALHQGDCAKDEGDAACTPCEPKSGLVLLRTGEERLDRVDLVIPGRAGMDFVFARRYRSQLWLNGPLGMAWDHDFNEGLFFAENGDVVRQNGGSRIATWTLAQSDDHDDGHDHDHTGAATYTAPHGYFGTLVRRDDGTYVLRQGDGFKRHYSADGRLVMHEDRHGNTLRFRHDDHGNIDLVIDTYGREITFVYDTFPNVVSGGSMRRLVKVVDFAGREVRYTYDVRGDLVLATTPAVTGTSTANDFPQGRSERYAYSTGFFDERLNHNLIAITSPEEVALGGPPTQTITYGTSSTNRLTFDKVLSETIGGTNASGVPAGGTRVFAYRDLNQDAPSDPNLPRLEVTVTDPAGNARVHLINEEGEDIIVRTLTRGVRTAEPAFYETRSFYNHDGLLVRRVYPEGNEERLTYGTASRSAQKHVVERRLIAGPRGDGRGGPSADLVTTFTYEPLFQRLASVTDARGNATSYLPPTGEPGRERYTTRFTFDYQEGAAPVPEAVEFGIDLSGMTRGLGDLNGDGRVDQAAGNVITTKAPSVLLDPASIEAARLGSTTQAIVTEVQWNDRGQVVATIDPEGLVNELRYHPENDPDGDGVAVPSPLVTTELRGYLRATVVDARTSPRRRTTAPPLGLTSTFRYDPVGNVTAVVNPRGVATTLEVNQLNQIVSVTRGAEVAEAIFSGELPMTEGPLAYVSRSFYDFNGRVVRSEVENRDGATEGVGAFVERTLVYDLLGRVVEVRAEVDQTTQLTTRVRYDPNGHPREVTSPLGHRALTTYDERELVHTVTRGVGTVHASTISLEYDKNGQPLRVTDAEDTDGDGLAEFTTLAYDGFGRPVEATDALGNRALTTYDVASNVIRSQVFGHGPGGAGTASVLLTDGRFTHDELGRVVRSDAALFVSPDFEPRRPALLQDQDGDGFVTSRVEYDALSRPTVMTEDDFQVTRVTYDGASRPIETVDAVGNRRTWAFDRNGNPIAVTSVEVSPEGLVQAEAFTTRYVYDQLDRLVRATDSAGQTSRFTYDSRDQLVQRSDPEGPLTADPLGLFPGEINAAGNTCTYVHDGLGRMIRQICDLRVGGTGAGALDTSNPNNVDGQISLGYVFDDDSRLVGIVDDNGNRTSFAYDALNRRTSQTNADGESYLFTFDRDDNIRTVTDPNGSVVTKLYDALNRMTETTVARGSGVFGTTRETYSYDGLSRLVRATDDNGSALAPQVTEYVYDSLSRLLEERQNDRAISSRYSGDGKRTQVTYPGGRTISRTFDAIDRIKLLKDGSTVLAHTDWIGPGMRELRRVNGNGTALTFLNDAGTADVGYDAVQRLVRLRVVNAASVPLVDREYSYNRASQRTVERRHDDFGLTDRYTYDSAYRVVASAYDQEGLFGAVPRDLSHAAYTLDGVGNRRSVEKLTSAGPVVDAYAVNVVNEYVSVAGVARTNDDNGNLTDDGTRLFFYDYKNRLVGVSERATGNPVASYEYLADGRRAKKVVYSQTTPGQVQKATAFFYDGAQEVEEQDAGSGATEATYVWSPVYVDELVTYTNAAGTFYTHQDARCDVVAITDAAGNVVERVRFDDFGRAEIRGPGGEVRAASAVGSVYGFQGRRLDAETGLLYFRARMYDPATGRFLQRDPVWDAGNVGGQYTFVGNGPVSGRDPSGLKEIGDASTLLPGLIADLASLGMPTAWLTALATAAPALEFHTTSGGPQYNHHRTPGFDDTLNLASTAYEQLPNGTWKIRGLLDLAAGAPGRPGDPELAAAMVEELFHAWMKLVIGGCAAAGYTEGQEEVMSDYIHRLVRQHLDLKVALDAGRISRQEATARWNDPTGAWTRTIPTPPGQPPLTSQEKTAVKSAFEDADAQRTIDGKPATDFRMTPAMRTWLVTTQGLNFEVGP